jgi:hypothetical protein
MTIRCNRCERRMRNPADWNVVVSRGVITGYLCPGCQTPEENAEAVINEATVEYVGVSVDGRLLGRPKSP